jgi:hypothetical protein
MENAEMSDQDKIFKAQELRQQIELEEDLAQFSKSLAQLFAIAPPLKLAPMERAELNTLSTAIQDAAEGNHARARIMELLTKGLSA